MQRWTSRAEESSANNRKYRCATLLSFHVFMSLKSRSIGDFTYLYQPFWQLPRLQSRPGLTLSTLDLFHGNLIHKAMHIKRDFMFRIEWNSFGARRPLEFLQATGKECFWSPTIKSPSLKPRVLFEWCIVSRRRRKRRQRNFTPVEFCHEVFSIEYCFRASKLLHCQKKRNTTQETTFITT